MSFVLVLVHAHMHIVGGFVTVLTFYLRHGSRKQSKVDQLLKQSDRIIPIPIHDCSTYLFLRIHPERNIHTIIGYQ